MSYTVLRNKLDPWLMAQAEQAGAQFILCTGRRLVREGNRVTGVQAVGMIPWMNSCDSRDGVTPCWAVRWTWCLSLCASPCRRRKRVDWALRHPIKSA